MDFNQIVAGILQIKEVIALVSVLAFCWFIMTKHIPFLLMRSDERAEREATRHQLNVESMERGLDKLSDAMSKGLSDLRQSILEISSAKTHYQQHDNKIIHPQ